MLDFPSKLFHSDTNLPWFVGVMFQGLVNEKCYPFATRSKMVKAGTRKPTRVPSYGKGL
jgi:hypothetical protein